MKRRILGNCSYLFRRHARSEALQSPDLWKRRSTTTWRNICNDSSAAGLRADDPGTQEGPGLRGRRLQGAAEEVRGLDKLGGNPLSKMPVKTSKPDLKSLLAAQQSQPHDLLGMHVTRNGRSSGLVVRALIHDAAECSVIDARDPAAIMAGGAARWPMKQLAPEGLFEVFIPGLQEVFRNADLLRLAKW